MLGKGVSPYTCSEKLIRGALGLGILKPKASERGRGMKIVMRVVVEYLLVSIIAFLTTVVVFSVLFSGIKNIIEDRDFLYNIIGMLQDHLMDSRLLLFYMLTVGGAIFEMVKERSKFHD